MHGEHDDDHVYGHNYDGGDHGDKIRSDQISTVVTIIDEYLAM